MNYKEVKKKVIDMHSILTQLKDLGGYVQINSENEENKKKFDEMADKIIVTLLETLLMGITASDMINEFNLDDKLNVAFHEKGYTHGIGEEFKRRVDAYTKRINKLK